MVRPPVSLEVINVARPCPADWEKMQGDDRVRFCTECSLHVYNLSAMTRDAAEQLVAEREGRLCVQFFRRADGTVITADCEGGWRDAARRAGRRATAAAALMLSTVLAPLGLSRWASASSTSKCDPAAATTVQPATPDAEPHKILGKVRATLVIKGEMAVPLMGALVVAPQVPATQSAQQPPAATQPAKSE